MKPVIVHSNAPWAATGYGQQCALTIRSLRDLGHDVAVSAFYGCNGALLTWEGVKVYPGGYDVYGNDVILTNANHHFGGNLHDGIILTLVDVWVLNSPQLSRANVACWTPVDHDPPPPRVVEALQTSGAVPVAMSRFGEHALRAEQFQPLYVPHSIDTTVFSPRERGEARRVVGLPNDAFVVGMVAANKGYPPRKGFPQVLQAFAEFRRDHPDALLYVHTETTGVVSGVNIPALIESLGLADSVKTCDPHNYLLGFSQEHMAHVYSAMDVLVNPAYGEGFGIPVIEAQACGTPVIVTDWTAMPEMVGAGWVVGGDRWWSEQGSWQKVPSVDEILSALESAYTLTGDAREAAAADARETAVGYERVTVRDEFWQPAMAALEERFADAPAEPVAA